MKPRRSSILLRIGRTRHLRERIQFVDLGLQSPGRQAIEVHEDDAKQDASCQVNAEAKLKRADLGMRAAAIETGEASPKGDMNLLKQVATLFRNGFVRSGDASEGGRVSSDCFVV